ncbi:hypothetical protein [Sporosalibacterium faouarense]|uniref:hypothetical protein n=1 Tax=Sporosalibacterium faouarense TaxID=516123 RepID=UPI00192ACE36|nr:hypothetical protein [Sporosalibacterium faouarense]
MIGNKKKNLFMILVCLALLSSYLYVVISSEFDMLSLTEMQKGRFVVHKNYYFGYAMQWNGVLKPKITKIELCKEDGTILNENDETINVKVYIDTSNHTGVLDDESYKEFVEKKVINYLEPKNLKLEPKEFTLVLKAKKKNEDFKDDYEKIVIYYKLLGLEKKQVFQFNGFES